MPLHVEQRERVAVLTIDDPDRKNALSPEMVDAIVETVGRLDDRRVGRRDGGDRRRAACSAPVPTSATS